MGDGLPSRIDPRSRILSLTFFLYFYFYKFWSLLFFDWLTDHSKKMTPVLQWTKSSVRCQTQSFTYITPPLWAHVAITGVSSIRSNLFYTHKAYSLKEQWNDKWCHKAIFACLDFKTENRSLQYLLQIQKQKKELSTQPNQTVPPGKQVGTKVVCKKKWRRPQ